jgi:translocation and assembly module TamB
MKADRPKFRKWLKAAGWTLAAVILLLILLPVWFPWALRPASSLWGVHYGAYHRAGYGRFILENFQLQEKQTRIGAERIECLLPGAWLWRRYVSSPATNSNPAKPTVRIAGWSVVVSKEETPSAGKEKTPSHPPVSTGRIIGIVDTVVTQLRRWLPDLEATNGVVRWKEGGLDLPEARWDRAVFQARVHLLDWGQTATVNADVSGAKPYSVRARLAPMGVSAETELERSGEAWKLGGVLHWKGVDLDLAARFEEQGWFPVRASLEARDFHLPAGALEIKDYREISGSASLHWKEGSYDLETVAHADPLPSASKALTPVDLRLGARGDLQTVSVTNLELNTPWLKVRLPEAHPVYFSTNWFRESARFQVNADLDQFPLLPVGGNLTGQVRLDLDPSGEPVAAFDFEARQPRGYGLEAETLGAAGRFHWPRLDLENANLKFADGSSLSGRFEFDLSSNYVQRAAWQFQGGLLNRYLTNLCRFQTVEASGTGSGPLTNLTQGGHATLTGLALPSLKRMNVALAWEGAGLALKQFQLTGEAGPARWNCQGEIRLDAADAWKTSMTLNAFSLIQAQAVLFELREPCRLTFRPNSRRPSGEQPAGWGMELDGFHWAGRGGDLRIDGSASWPDRGRVDAQVQAVALEDFQAFFAASLPGLKMDNLSLHGNWDHGPLEFNLAGSASYGAEEGGLYRAHLEVEGGKTGLRVGSLELSEGGTRLATGQGALPLILNPGNAARPWQGLAAQTMDLDIQLEKKIGLWKFLARRVGVRISEPQARLHLSGSVVQPKARFTFQASRLEVATNLLNRSWPSLDGLQVRANLTPDEIALETLSFRVEDQTLTASGDLPLEKDFWKTLSARRRLPDWRQAQARLDFSDVDFGRLTQYLSKDLTPQGKLDLHLETHPGGLLEGELVLTNLTSRPLPRLGPIRDVSLRASLSNQTVRVQEFTGNLGGQPVTVTGGLVWNGWKPPRLDLRLTGRNVPIARDPSLMLRSDLDLRLHPLDSGPTNLISGSVDLRQSLLFQNLKMFLPGSVSKPSQRPPYFSVETPPFADWLLDVKIKGEKFLQIRSPLFRGEVSALFDLKGTLKEPVAIGSARAESGRVQFPFGTLNIEQGMVSLTSENPYEPQLFVIASGRNFGYDVKMELSGPVSNPVVLFSSRPPLSSEEVILMLTAGEVPSRDIYGSAQARTGRAMMFFGRDFLSWVGLDAGTTERLTISSGQDISEQGRPTYYIEYRLNDRWSVTGEYDRFNEMNAGLKWRIYSK